MNNKNKYRAFVVLGLAFLMSAAFSRATSYNVISVANGSASGNLFAAGSAAGSAGGSFSTSSSHLVFTSSSTTGGLSYFVATLGAGQPSLSLVNAGDTITLNFTVTGYHINAQSQEIRFGLFDVGDTFSSTFNADSTFGAEKGYSASYGNTGNNNNGIYQRTGTNANLFAGAAELSTSGTNFALASRAYSTSGWGGSTGYTTSGSLTLTLLSDGQVSVTSAIGSAGLSGAQTYTSTTSITSFNAIAFAVVGIKDGSSAQLDFSNLTLTYTPAIPEPHTAALLLGGIALAGALLRRRCRRDR